MRQRSGWGGPWRSAWSSDPGPARTDRAVTLKSQHFLQSPRRSRPRRRWVRVCARPGAAGDESGPRRSLGQQDAAPAHGPGEEGRTSRQRAGLCPWPSAQRAPAQRQPRGPGPARCSVTSAGRWRESHREPALQELVSGRPSSAASRALACRWARAALECRHLGDPQRQLNSLPLMSQKRCP